MMTLDELTPEERAALTQEQIDVAIKEAGGGPAFLTGGGFHVTPEYIRRYEALHNQTELPGRYSFETGLMLAMQAEAL